MIILFQNIFLKEFLACNGFFGLFTKVKKGSEMVPIFCMIFQWKCSLFNTLSLDKVSISYLFSSLRNETKWLIKFLIRQLMTSQTLRFIFHQPLKQWLTGRKEGKTEIQKFQYLENKKSFLDEIKSIFIVFEGLSFGDK